jgi:hypothetical protein
MTQTETTSCPVCGATMNHHADKLVYIAEAGGASEAVEEFHSCPNCGASASRPAALDT